MKTRARPFDSKPFVPPPGFGVRRPSGAFLDTGRDAKAAEGRRTPGRYRDTAALGFFLALLVSSALAAAGQSTPPLRPPAAALVTHDPYFSIWSPADKLTDADTIHWTGKPHRLTSLVRIDGKAFRVMGKEPANVPALPQTNLEVLPARTIYTFEGEGVRLTLTFMTPALPEDLEVLARPVTYVTYEIVARDRKSRAIEVYLDASAELAVNERGQQVTWTEEKIENLASLKVGSQEQGILAKQGDDIRIDWGHLYITAPELALETYIFHQSDAVRSVFIEDGLKPRLWRALAQPSAAGAVVAALAFKQVTVSSQPTSRWLMLAYDDEFSIQYMRKNLRPYWRRNGDDAAALLKKAAADYESLKKRCAAFDAELMTDLRRVGGEKYARLAALAYRQCFAAGKFVADANGKPLHFCKENHSNGCIGTSDVFYPMSPQFLLFGPRLAKSFLVPFMNYAASERWKFPFAPHDLGTYPHANGQVYGGGERNERDQMPVEESGNLLILFAAIAEMEGNADFAGLYWKQLEQWAEYLKAKGFDPENQLCTDDFAGHLAHNVNLSAKAIIGLGAFGKLCDLRGDKAKAAEYSKLAKEFATRWVKEADDGDHFRLAFDRPGTWSQKYNLIWDRILDLNLFPAEVARKEMEFYRKTQNTYGLPLDNRKDYTKLDWITWTATLTQNRADFEALIDPVYKFLNETPQRSPMTDWYETKTAKKVGFTARPVVGGVFAQLLYDKAVWKKWASRDKTKASGWAPIPPPPKITTVVPAADTAPATWRYTTEKPADDWAKPGFDDSAWKEGKSGFGTEDTPGAVIGTTWDTPDIWLRREVDIRADKLKNLELWIHHDEDARVFINGVAAAHPRGYVTEYFSLPLSTQGQAALKAGKNVIAVHCHQTGGGQHIDVGFVSVTEGERLTAPSLPPLKPLFDYPLRDTSICLAPDGFYYLTGTTGHPTWWTNNEGIRVWKSADLNDWRPLGLVWSIERNGTWQRKVVDGKRAIWAPEIHCAKGTFWLTYCMNYGGTGLLKSTSGQADGPYVDVKPDGPLTGEIDASLFQDDDGQAYFVFQNGKIALLCDDWSALAEPPRLLKPANAGHVGFEGAFLFKAGGRYHLACAEFAGEDYHCLIASADKLEGPYGERYLAIPHGGHNMFFRDKTGQWWSTIFGNSGNAPFRERPGILRVAFRNDGRVSPAAP